MAYKSMNFDTLMTFVSYARAAEIDFRIERKQVGKHIWAQAFVRNCTGDEANCHVQIYIDDVANVAYVALLCNSADKYKYLHDKIAEQENVTAIAESEYDWNENNLLFKLNNKFKFVSNGNKRRWVDEILHQVNDLLKIVSNIVY